MLAALALAALALPQEPDYETPSPERVERALSELDAAWSRKGEELAQAIVQNSEVADAKVIARIAKAFDVEEPEVSSQVLQALRYQRHPTALKELYTLLKRQRKLDETPELQAGLFRAIGQHADPASLERLSKTSLRTTDERAMRARLYAMARIRSTDSIEALIALMNKAERREAYRWMADFRLALMVLTGTDQGRSQERWSAWWSANRKTFKVAKELPKLPKRDALNWLRYWGEEYEEERARRREDRGRRGS